MPVEIADALTTSLREVTKSWTKLKKQRERDQQAALNRMRRRAAREVSITEAAFDVMEACYRRGSENGRYPLHLRQLMYLVRERVLQLTTKPWTGQTGRYFCGTVWPEYLRAHRGADAWNIAYDDRGHFYEPFGVSPVGLGTLAVRDYLRRWTDATLPSQPLRVADVLQYARRLPTTGPALRFHHALFVEKEGFFPLFEQARLQERYDLALFSTKGVSTRAARELVDRLSSAGVTVLVLHDFDKAGFTILHTLGHDSDTYTFRRRPRVVDLGLRLAQAQALDIPSEPVSYKGGEVREYLASRGATGDEVDFLVQERDWNGTLSGERIELNAMLPAQLLAWLEDELDAHDVAKILPDDAAVLTTTWQRQRLIARIEQAVTTLVETGTPETAPPDLRHQLALLMEENGDESWDALLADLARDDLQKDATAEPVD
jgi:hypothetical protein